MTSTNARHCYFDIAGLVVEILFNDLDIDISLLPSFSNFRATHDSNKETLFTLTVTDKDICYKGVLENIKTFDTGNGDIRVERTEEGGYLFHLYNIQGVLCCTMLCDKTFRQCTCKIIGDFCMKRYGLNNAIMLAYAFAGTKKQALLVHASLVRHGGKGYAFVAQSGTGKSTHTSLWLKHIPGCDLMNDDNPVIRIENGKPFIYGSPWSGKTPCYRQVKAPLGAITRIDRATKNSIEKLRPVQAFASLLPCCSTMKWDEKLYNEYCNTLTEIIKTTNIYTLHCLPDKEAAILCNKEISK
ncbi:MAG: hypothetical protein ACI4V5_07850 [Prevotella sp.]